MNNEYKNLIEKLNDKSCEVRLQALSGLKKAIDTGRLEKPQKGNYANNHIHTTYSFSPYSPTKAVWMAYNAGLPTAGIMDHDSISGAREFIEAGEIIGVATTIGLECRVSLSNTPLSGRRINNPDQDSIAYMAVHAVAHTQIDTVNEFFRPYRDERNKRNRCMVNRLNELMEPYGVQLDFYRDVVPLSMCDEGGSITERHILFALSKILVMKYGKGEKLKNFLVQSLKLDIKPRIMEYLLDGSNEFYEYDLLGVLKSDMVGKFYIDADTECPDVSDVLKLSKDTGSISAYAYLGDVGNSVTGDKKTQKFEDDYIELLFETLSGLGFDAVTYMPSRNSLKQLEKVKKLCEKHNLLQISGEDINSPRQSFICEALARDEFKHLIDSTWMLIEHERKEDTLI
jgi:hypothetical protein